MDTEAGVLREVWNYGEQVDIQILYAGEAVRQEAGTTFINYGTEGMAREVTQDGETAWALRWDGRLMLGHSELVDDLYALRGSAP